MRPIDVELAEIEFLRELMLAEYHVRNLRWNAVQAASLAASGLAAIAHLGGSLADGAFFVIVSASMAAILLSAVVLLRTDAFFAGEGNLLLARFKRLKRE